jgi:cytidyltransferase-like protein
MKYKYKYGVVIGRFQPIHKGHISVIKQALDIADNVIICVGSSSNESTFKNPLAMQRYTFRNPFSFKERKEMIIFSLKELFGDDFRWKDDDIGIIGRIKIIPIVDYYNDEIGCSAWVYHVMTQLSQAYSNDIFEKGNSCYIGHYKDDSSEYLNWFKFMTFIPCKQDETMGLIHATDIRNAMLNGNMDSVKPYISDYVFQKLKVHYKFEKTHAKVNLSKNNSDDYKTIVIFGDNILLAENKLPRFSELDLPASFIKNKQKVLLGDEFVNVIISDNYDFNTETLPNILLDCRFNLTSLKSAFVSDMEDIDVIQHYLLSIINNQLKVI